jgi:hypothetical protein
MGGIDRPSSGSPERPCPSSRDGQMPRERSGMMTPGNGTDRLGGTLAKGLTTQSVVTQEVID